MRFFNTVSLALAALPVSTFAVSLVDFPPRLSNLPSACNAVYTAQIVGCSSTDFTSGTCSATCVAALVALEPFVEVGCGLAGVTGQNVIAAFLAGQGPSSLCSDAKAVLSSSSSSSSSSTAQSTSTNIVLGPPSQVTQSSKAENLWTTASSTATSSSSSLSSSSSVVNLISASTTSSALTTSSPNAASSTSPATIHSTTAVEHTSSSTTTSAQSTQKTSTNQGGGGSPFDTSSDATALMMSVPAALALSGLIMFAAMW